MNPLPERSIIVQTYEGTGIENCIDVDPDDQAIQAAWAFGGMHRLLRHGDVAQLGPPTGRYNCHGLVFGSRRTNIPPVELDDPTLVDRVLADDGFRRTPFCRIGDVVIYRNSSGEVDHSGIVVRIDRLGDARVPRVWSAWGQLGEFEHHELLTPYQDCQVEYWRLV